MMFYSHDEQGKQGIRLVKAAVVLAVVLLAACSQQGTQKKDVITKRELKEPLIRANKSIVDKEADKIDKYIRRRNWKMTETGTGLRYLIYQEGSGEPAEEGQYAKVSYEIRLLDGTICYSSADDRGPRSFLIGRDNVESGIHEGITYMRVGDRAKFILPSHLAHGLTGDHNKIPPRSVLIVDIELLALSGS